MCTTNLTAGLTGIPSHQPNPAGTHPSRIDTCHGDATTVHVNEATYGDFRPAGTAHSPSTSTSSSRTTMPDNSLPAALQFRLQDNHSPWHKSNSAHHAIICRNAAPTLTTAMCQAAQGCGSPQLDRWEAQCQRRVRHGTRH